jgi:pimeloyl-ACP methyl ester carboxylesterase
MAEELTIDLPTLGMRLAARAHGPASGARVLALHGWLDNAASFDQLAPRLPGLRVVALDLPGHGLSDREPAGSVYAFVDLVAQVHFAVRALGWSRYSLLGHSLGASIAAMLAGIVPDAVERLALIEGLGPLSEAPQHAPERFAKSLRDQEDKHGRAPPVHADVDAALSRLGSSLARMSESSARTLLSRGLVATEGGVTWRSDPRLRLPSRTRMVEEQVLAFLAAIRCPALLVRASRGFPPNDEQYARRIATVPGLRVVELDAGHHVHLDDPELVAAHVGPFLAGAAP